MIAMKRLILLEAICFLLALLFLYTAISKLVAFHQFAYDMHNQVFPHWVVDYILIPGVPTIEILIATGLYATSAKSISIPIGNKSLRFSMPALRLPALFASLTMMFLFTVYTSLVLWHIFPRVPCSCGGIIRSLSWKQHVFFNVFFLGVSIAGIWLYKTEKRNNQQMPAIFTSA